MITTILCGHFPLEENHKSLPFFPHFMHSLKPNSEPQSNVFNVIMDENLITNTLHSFVTKMVWYSVFLVHTLHHKMAKLKVKYEQLIISSVLALLIHLCYHHWHHALQITTYLQNILPIKILSHHSLTQYLYHRDPSYTHLRVFGCLCYPLFPSTTINKLQARSTPCAFLGYPQNHRGYKCYDLSRKKIIISRHVIFGETQFPFAKTHTPSTPTYEFLNDDLHPLLHDHLQNDPKQDEPEPPIIESPQPATTPASPINVTNQSEGEKNHKKGGGGGLNCVFGTFFFYVLDNCPQVQSLK